MHPHSEIKRNLHSGGISVIFLQQFGDKMECNAAFIIILITTEFNNVT